MFHVVIPARLASARLPGKVLKKIGNKTMLERVYDKAVKSGADSIIIATDAPEVVAVAEGFGATAMISCSQHETGTDRIAEVVSQLDFEDDDIIVGLQADEPFLPHEVIVQLAEDMQEHTNIKVASLYQPIEAPEELFDPHVTKVVLNRRNHALYFSRAPIPWSRDEFEPGQIPSSIPQDLYLRHIGLYAYRAQFLQEYVQMDPPSIEQVEYLEQLRILWQGVRIQMSCAKRQVPPGIDTLEDLNKAQSSV